MQINGNTEIIAHIGFPTHSFKSPMVYNPYFLQQGIDARVIPMGCDESDFSHVFPGIFRLSNLRGALITMPHKVAVMALIDDISPTAFIAGACNAVKRGADGRLKGDMFDGEGFIRGVQRKGVKLTGASAMVIGNGGVGSAIAASLAAAGVASLALYDTHSASSSSLAQRLCKHYPKLAVSTGSNDPAGFDLLVNASPLGMNEDDPLPIDIQRLDAATFVGEVVMRQEMTAFLAAAASRRCRFQVGSDMLFEQIPAYLEFFGFPATTAENLRSIAQLGQH